MYRTTLFTFTFLIFLYDLSVHSIHLEGPVLTRYDPCGLGVIHFDRLREKHWKGVLNFGLYSNHTEVDMEVYFEVPVAVDTLPNQTFDARSTSFNKLQVRHVSPIPKQYNFLLEVVGNGSDVPIVSKFVLNGAILCSDDIKATQTVQSLDVFGKYPKEKYAHVCGRRSMEHTELVSVRTEARAGDWPWHVTVIRKCPISINGIHLCGGNIISRSAVLTAGHCVYENGSVSEPHRVTVVAGTNLIRKLNNRDLTQPGRQILIAQKIILHPAYNKESSTSDLAIIKVDRFTYTEYVQPICIWGPSYDKTSLFGKEATVVGLGRTENNETPDILRASNTLVQNDSECINFKPAIYANLVNEFTFCAGFGPNVSVNPSYGDSGGGLTLSIMQPDHMVSWVLRGIVSRCGLGPDDKGCNPTYYAVYTDVAPHYGWIIHHSGLEFQKNVP